MSFFTLSEDMTASIVDAVNHTDIVSSTDLDVV
jgi:hypothetical protein